MNTKILMISSAIILAGVGITLTFMPREVAIFLQMTDATVILLQIIGALYFGFAMLNWTAKTNLIGGIYSRPVCIGNFTHFLIGGLSLIKLAYNHFTITILICALLYLIYALLFGYVLLNNPSSSKKKLASIIYRRGSCPHEPHSVKVTTKSNLFIKFISEMVRDTNHGIR